jgi:hypothetical protein
MTRVIVLLLLFLATAVVCTADDTQHSLRLGDLEITATAAGAISPQMSGFLSAPGSGRHFVAVRVKDKNVAAYRSCTEFDPLLEVDSGENRQGPSLGTGLIWPETVNLPPAGESEGRYTFEVEDGTKPVALILVRHSNAEDLCAMVQERQAFAPENTEVRIDLEGLPNQQNEDRKPEEWK